MRACAFFIIGYAQIKYLGLFRMVLRRIKIAGLDIAMDDAVVMQMLQALQIAHENTECFDGIQARFRVFDSVAQARGGHPFQIFKNQIILPFVGALANLHKINIFRQIWMCRIPKYFCFANKTRRVAGTEQALDCHFAFITHPPRPEHFPKSTFSQPLDKFI